MELEKLRAALDRRERVWGTCIISPSPRLVSAVAGMGLDFVFIDTEHIPLDRERVSWMCHAYAGVGLAPIVRIPYPDPHLVRMALDGGAQGIIVPYVESSEQARELVAAASLRPLKGRLAQEHGAGRDSLPAELAGYLARNYPRPLCIVNVESVPALEALEDIAAVPGLDALLIGPHDLSVSLGVPEQYAHPRFDAAIRTIARAAGRHGVAAGIHWSWDIRPLVDWARAGLSFIIYSSDLNAFVQGVRRDVESIKASLDDSEAPQGRPAGAESTV